MKPFKIFTRTLGFVILFSMVACQPREKSGSHSSTPSPKEATDTDLGHGYVRRDGAIHFIGGGTTGTGANATRIDKPSPDILRKLVLSQYGPFKTAEGLDAASFKALSPTYTLDKNHVYYKIDDIKKFIIIQLPKADPESFRILPSGHVSDKNHVWNGDSIVSGVDPDSIKMINPAFTVFRDKDSVHYQYDKIPGTDPASFKHIGSGYYADSRRVYWSSTPIPDADPATFKVLGNSFVAKDKRRAYRSGETLIGLDAASLELIVHHDSGYQIYSDKNGIHVNKMPFPRAKPGQAEVIERDAVKVGNLILLVEDSRNTPTTLFKQDGKLRVESPAYDPSNDKVNGIISADVTAEGLKNIQVNPLPGSNQAPTVPDWQMEVFTHGHTAKRMIELGKRIK